LKSGLEVTQVIEDGIIRNLGYGFPIRIPWPYL